MAGESMGYREWLARRLSDGVSDMARVRRQIELWKASPPKGTGPDLFDGMLRELDGKGAGRKPRPSPPAEELGGFD